jgi:hypothetical protein
MYPEDEEAENDEDEVLDQPLLNGSDSDGDSSGGISASADDATESGMNLAVRI